MSECVIQSRADSVGEDSMYPHYQSDGRLLNANGTNKDRQKAVQLLHGAVEMSMAASEALQKSMMDEAAFAMAVEVPDFIERALELMGEKVSDSLLLIGPGDEIARVFGGNIPACIDSPF